jgi:hypothetical protein
MNYPRSWGPYFPCKQALPKTRAKDRRDSVFMPPVPVSKAHKKSQVYWLEHYEQMDSRLKTITGIFTRIKELPIFNVKLKTLRAKRQFVHSLGLIRVAVKPYPMLIASPGRCNARKYAVGGP